MRRIERKAIAIETGRIAQLLDSIEDALNVGLKPVPALLELAELEPDFGRMEQQSVEHP